MEDMFFLNIDKYVYDECTKEEMDLFLEHITTCDKCKAEYELSCSVRDAMHSMHITAPPADFSKLVNDRLDQELAAPKKKRFISAGYRKYSAVAACLVLAVALGVENLNLTDSAPLEATTIKEEGLQPVPDIKEQEQEIAPAPQQEVPVIQEPVSVASTKNTAEALPAATPKPVVQTKPEPVVPNQPVVQPEPEPTPVVSEPTYSPEDDSWTLPEHLDPTKNVVLASSVEKKYQISGVDPDYVPKKERDLAKEFSLLETTNTGVIVASAANISSLEGVRFGVDEETKKSKAYGVGSGSIFISSKDKTAVDELLTKYISVEEGGCCFFIGENFESFIEEMDSMGIPYEEKLMTERGSNVAIKVIVG